MEKKIKIYSLTTTYPESSDSTTHQFVHLLNKELVKLGFDIKTITPHSKGLTTKEVIDTVRIKRFRYLPENSEIGSLSITDLINTSKVGFLKVTIMMMSFFISTFFECLKEKPDILHGHWAFPGGYIAVILSIIFRKKSVVTIHGGFSVLKKFKLLRKIVITSLNKSSYIITNSNYTKNKFIEMGLKNENICRIFVPPNFIEHDPDVNSLEKFREKFVDPSHKLILFVGGLREVKGIEFLIKSLLEIKNAKVHLVIVGYGILLEQLKKLTISNGLENNVTFFGAAKPKEVANFYAISDVFVLPSIIDSGGFTEAMGLVIPEAMRSGLPVVASSVGGIVDIIEDGVNGLLVEQKEPKSIANAIERILTNKDLEKRINENSKKTVEQFYPEIIAKQHLKIFQDVLKNN